MKDEKKKKKKIVKVCLHSDKAVQVSFQFDDIFDKKYQISNVTNLKLFFEKVYIQNLLGHPPERYF